MRIALAFAAGALVTAASRIALRAIKAARLRLQIRRGERKLAKARADLDAALKRRRVYNGPTRAETIGWCPAWERELDEILDGPQ